MSESDEHTSTEWDGLEEVGKYPTLAQAHEHALVILAMRQPCWVAKVPETDDYSLHAEVDSVPAILRELLDYDNEQFTAPAAPSIEPDVFRHPAGWGVYGIWALTLILIYLFQEPMPWLVDQGSSSSIDLIANHQWWRPFTALFLHADPPHLIGNLLSGMLFGTLVSRSIGPLRAWALILACGTLGNAITSLVTSLVTSPEPFRSIGASTAVFGALGILSGLGFSFMLRHRFRLPWARVAAPVLAGIVLLGWLGGGTPGGETDVLGHVFGFASGLTSGLIIGRLSPATAGALIAGNAMAERDART